MYPETFIWNWPLLSGVGGAESGGEIAEVPAEILGLAIH